jgi:hypothetical protein
MTTETKLTDDQVTLLFKPRQLSYLDFSETRLLLSKLSGYLEGSASSTTGSRKEHLADLAAECDRELVRLKSLFLKEI